MSVIRLCLEGGSGTDPLPKEVNSLGPLPSFDLRSGASLAARRRVLDPSALLGRMASRAFVLLLPTSFQTQPNSASVSWA